MTLYLSRLALDPHLKQPQKELTDPYQLHRTVLSAFPTPLPPTERVLYRLETSLHTLVLLVQSHTRPDWTSLKNRPYLEPSDPFSGAENPAVKPLSLTFQAGQLLYFRLRANPTVKKERPDKKHSRRHALLKEEEQIAWLTRQAAQHGFSFDPHRVRLSHKQQHQAYIPRPTQAEKLTLFTVQFDGLCQVENPEKLLQAVTQGIGPGRAFGCGLLSLAPAG